MFSQLLILAKEQGFFHAVKVAKGGPSIFHLLFANDLMIFARANRKEAVVIIDALAKYSWWSGQRVNFRKSALYCSGNTHSELAANLFEVFHAKPMSFDTKYLGVPLFIGRARKKNL